MNPASFPELPTPSGAGKPSETNHSERNCFLETKIGKTYLVTLLIPSEGPINDFKGSGNRQMGKQPGYLLVLAAAEVCRLLGFPELFSACDLSQDGHAFAGACTELTLKC